MEYRSVNRFTKHLVRRYSSKRALIGGTWQQFY